MQQLNILDDIEENEVIEKLVLEDDEWKECNLGEIAILRNGKTKPSNIGLYPVYGGNGILGYSNEYNSSGEVIVIGRVGAYCGSVYYENRAIWVSDNAMFAIPKENNNTKFLYYLLKNNNLNKYAQGSSHPLLNQSILNNLELEVPHNNREQEQIAKILSSLDDKIELNQKMNKTLEEIAQTIFKHWFIDFEFPNEEGKPYKSSGGEMVESELGDIPRDWNISAIYDLASFINGSSFKEEDFSSDKSGLPIIKIIELKNGITNQTKYTNKKVDSKYLINNNDILFSWSGSPDTSIDIFIFSEGLAVLNQHTFKVVSKDKNEYPFIYLLLKHLKPIFIEIARDKQTTGLGHVTVKDLKEMKFIIPPENVIKKFYELTYPILGKYILSKIQINNLAKIRDSLLPKLMSGEIRTNSSPNPFSPAFKGSKEGEQES